MALIKCPECGGTVSSLASVCPHCGNPMSSPSVPPTEPMPTTVITKAPDPEPGEKMQDQAAALRTLLENSRTDNTFTSPLSDPQESAEVSASSFGKVLMILIGIVSVIFLGIVRSYLYKPYGALSPNVGKAAIGIMYSFVALFFLTKFVGTKSTASQRFLGLLGAGFALLIEIVRLSDLDDKQLFWENNLSYFSLAFAFILLLFSGTVRNYSKYVFMAAGVMMIATIGLFKYNITYTMPTGAFIALGIAGALAFFMMLVGWIVEATTNDNHPIARVMAAIEALLILTAIIILAVCLKDIISSNAYTWEAELKRFSQLKLSMIFLLIAGMSSLLFSLLFSNNSFIFIASAFFGAISLFLMLGLYSSFIEMGYGHPGANFGRDVWNVSFAALFLIPISIMTYYFAELTGSFKGKITINIQ